MRQTDTRRRPDNPPRERGTVRRLALGRRCESLLALTQPDLAWRAQGLPKRESRASKSGTVLHMTAGAGPIDPAGSPSWAVAGRVVTMDPASTVVADGAVWIKDAAIAAITRRGDATPPGFDGV